MDWELERRMGRERLADFHEDARRWRFARSVETGEKARAAAKRPGTAQPRTFRTVFHPVLASIAALLASALR